MTLSTPLIVELLLLGVATGFLAGLLGIGGGMILVPFLTFIMSQRGLPPDAAVKVAIATSMATIVFTSLSSIRAQQKRGAIRWDIVRHLTPGLLIGALLASAGMFSLLKGKWLALFFAVFVGFSAFQMIRQSKPTAARGMPKPSGQWVAGGVIGFLSGMVGAGGGFVSVPFLVWCNVAVHQAVATSAALGLPIALFNVMGYVVSGSQQSGLPEGAVGYIYLPAMAIIALASVFLAPLGVRASHALPVAQLKKVFASVLFVLAGYMLIKGLSGN
jgi:uncharacterized membrane protein YfcA